MRGGKRHSHGGDVRGVGVYQRYLRNARNAALKLGDSLNLFISLGASIEAQAMYLSQRCRSIPSRRAYSRGLRRPHFGST